MSLCKFLVARHLSLIIHADVTLSLERGSLKGQGKGKSLRTVRVLIKDVMPTNSHAVAPQERELIAILKCKLNSSHFHWWRAVSCLIFSLPLFCTLLILFADLSIRKFSKITILDPWLFSFSLENFVLKWLHLAIALDPMVPNFARDLTSSHIFSFSFLKRFLSTIVSNAANNREIYVLAPILWATWS